MTDWSDLRFFLELARTGTLAAAARKLGVDNTTVGRRLSALERDLGAKLFERTPDGVVITVAGEAIRTACVAFEKRGAAGLVVGKPRAAARRRRPLSRSRSASTICGSLRLSVPRAARRCAGTGHGSFQGRRIEVQWTSAAPGPATPQTAPSASIGSPSATGGATLESISQTTRGKVPGRAALSAPASPITTNALPSLIRRTRASSEVPMWTTTPETCTLDPIHRIAAPGCDIDRTNSLGVTR
jgi:hypothetical protein